MVMGLFVCRVVAAIVAVAVAVVVVAAAAVDATWRGWDDTDTGEVEARERRDGGTGPLGGGLLDIIFKN